MKKRIYLLTALMVFATHNWAGTYEEGFESVNDLQNQGWTFENRSDFIGDFFWTQGNPNLFAAQAGTDQSYILGGTGQTAGNILCDWLILPDIGHVDQLNFYTRTESNSHAADRLMVVYSASGNTNTGPCVADQPNKGLGSNDFGDFEVIHSVNEDLIAGGYPEQWTEINVSVNGSGRLALVYFVEDVGQPPFNGNLIAIDSINLGAGTPQGTPTPVPSMNIWGIMLMLLTMFALPAYYMTKR
jgi:hypothetical protein